MNVNRIDTTAISHNVIESIQSMSLRVTLRTACFTLTTLLLWVGAACAQPAGQPSYDIKQQEGYVEVDSSISLYYRIVGQAPDTVVVLAGGPKHMNYLEPDLRPLALSHTLIFYDQRSGGHSKPIITDTTRLHWRKFVGDLEALRKHFGLGKLNLMGHSWGGHLAALYAMEFPSRVNRLLLLDAGPPPYRGSPHDMDRLPVVERLDPRSRKKLKKAEKQWGATPDSTNKCWAAESQRVKGYLHNTAFAGQTWGDVCNVPQEKMLAPNQGFVWRSSLGDYDWRNRFEDFEKPVYIVHGESDVVPVGVAREWKGVFPNAQLTVIEDAGHFPHFENPDAFFPVAKSFFQGEWPARVPEAKAEWPPAPQQATSDYERLWWEITQAHDRLEAAFSQQDPEMGASIYTEDAILFAPTAPPIRGHRQIRAFLRGTFNKGARSADFQTLDLEGTEQRLTEGGRYALRDGDGQVLDLGKYLVVWRKVGGDWKIHRDMFNTTMEVPSALYNYDLERWQSESSAQ